MSIRDHEFDGAIDVACYQDRSGEPLFIQLDTGCDVVDLYRRDAIAIANHFKLNLKEMEE